ncbi:glycoside hydrolase family 2 TIM barrel-domain containing protein [Peribacillus kribbensis]|uniref:glycoside hydrolase family 2 TIM barrel-domain containing protein n=1 Tax=Peribacillus kribbensis TaxID=356658 RepID=UPI000403418B|nr:glycoside hydrolase family 2 TIM barrel-domain containing protein [Peribacillus kribbensis]
MSENPSIKWLSDPSIYMVNRLPAHSDHTYYSSMDEARNGEPMNMRYSLNGDWKFYYSINPDNRPHEFYKQESSCNGWGDITVPGHIQLQGHGQPQYVNTMYPWDGHNEIRPPEIPQDKNPVGSYVKYFTLPQHMKGNPLYISFQGVESAFYVWLNGHFVGYSEDSFTPADFELTQFLTEGENKLAVEVYQRSTGSWLEDQDFWRFSGIFREVYLYTIPDIHIFDARIRPELDDSFTKGTLHASLQLMGDYSGAQVRAALYDAEGRLAGSADAEVEGDRAAVSIQVERPSLWSAEDPYLYQVFFKVTDRVGRIVEVVPQKAGFRKFELVDKIMKLNGKRIVFKGVNRHEFNCRTGRTLTKEDMLWDIKTLKRNNINAVRTSHYPNQTYWYELCDEYGVYVIDEMNLETHGSWQKMGAVEPSWNIPGNKPEWQDIVMDRAISMYERDKNHPSILIWSCGNESYAGKVILNVSKYFKSQDPGRLVHYEGVFHNRDYNETSDMESRMYAKPADIEKYLTEDPEKPYISCEYMHAMGNSIGGMYKYTDLEKKYEMYQGGFIWDYIDQSLVKTDRYGEEFLAYGGDFGDRPTDYGFCTNGLVYANREESPKMQEVKFLYQDFKLAPEKGGTTVVNESLFSRGEDCLLEVALFHEGREVYREQREVAAEPQSEVFIEHRLPEALLEKAGEYSIQSSLKLKEAAKWAEAGYEIAFGEHIFEVQGQEPENIQGELRTVRGDVNIGVHGRDFSILFSKQAGSLVSMNYAGREMISFPPYPLFWRATTDNDRGFGQSFHSGVWMAASFARRHTAVEVVEEEDRVQVAFTYAFSIHQEIEVKTLYTVLADGSVHVKMSYKGAAGLPQMPLFGLTFKVPADYDQLKWYAMGPEENYSDRAKGARLGIFENTVEENFSGYLMPQESGNRTGVRWMEVVNERGQGIKISSVTDPLEYSVSPYTALELENAQHLFELPNVHYTVITVAGKQMGVGGDDSWGAPVHDEYLIQGNENIEFEFKMERI